jgi:ankyrin repeat protein
MMAHQSPCVVEVLLNAPAIDANAVDGLGRTALNHAFEAGHIEAATLLLNIAGVGINAADCQGQPALVQASLKRRNETIKHTLQFPGLRASHQTTGQR